MAENSRDPGGGGRRLRSEWAIYQQSAAYFIGCKRRGASRRRRPPRDREQIWPAWAYEIADTWVRTIRILDRTKKSEQQAS
jgi:hypothetical protein